MVGEKMARKRKPAGTPRSPTSDARTPRPADRPAGLTLPTVWASWLPDPDGETMTAMRRYLEAMDRTVAGGATATDNAAALSQSVFELYRAATAERHAQSGGA